MRLWVKKKPTAMSADIGRMIAEDWRTEYSDFGTVEGRLETIQDKGTLLIYVRDPLFSSSVRCYFDEDLLPQVFECFRKRVEITGTIHYRRNGTPTSIEAASITPLPDDSELPSEEARPKEAPQMIWDVTAGIVIGGSVWALVLFGYALLGTRECTSPRRAVSRVHWG
jgi:hypothetical protein